MSALFTSESCCCFLFYVQCYIFNSIFFVVFGSTYNLTPWFCKWNYDNCWLLKHCLKNHFIGFSLKRVFGTIWSLKPKIICCLYRIVVRPMVTYLSLVWWPKIYEKTGQGTLQKLQRLVCLETTKFWKCLEHRWSKTRKVVGFGIH